LWYRKPFNNFGDYRWQCTWYCKGRVGEVLRINLAVTGNAGDWTGTYSSTANRVDANGNATGQTTTVHLETNGSNPRANSVSVFKYWVGPPYVEVGGYYGHVVYIEKVSGGKVTFTDSNGSDRAVRTVTEDIRVFYTRYNEKQLPSGAASAFKGYLYF
jgi:surface antigen